MNDEKTPFKSLMEHLEAGPKKTKSGPSIPYYDVKLAGEVSGRISGKHTAIEAFHERIKKAFARGR